MEEILKYTGIGGLALTLLFLLFKNIIKKNIFPSLSQEQGYKILRLIIVLVFIISLISILIYFSLNYWGQPNKVSTQKKDSSTTSIDITGNNNNTIQGNNNSIVNNISNGPPIYGNGGIDNDSDAETSDKPDSLAKFLMTNIGKEVILNLWMANPKGFAKDTVDATYTRDPYDVFLFEWKDTDDDKEFSKVTELEFTCLVFSNRYSKETGSEKSPLYYREHPDEKRVVVNINAKNEALVTCQKFSIYVKGKYLVSYGGGQQMQDDYISLLPVN